MPNYLHYCISCCIFASGMGKGGNEKLTALKGKRVTNGHLFDGN